MECCDLIQEEVMNRVHGHWEPGMLSVWKLEGAMLERFWSTPPVWYLPFVYGSPYVSSQLKIHHGNASSVAVAIGRRWNSEPESLFRIYCHIGWRDFQFKFVAGWVIWCFCFGSAEYVEMVGIWVFDRNCVMEITRRIEKKASSVHCGNWWSFRRTVTRSKSILYFQLSVANRLLLNLRARGLSGTELQNLNFPTQKVEHSFTKEPAWLIVGSIWKEYDKMGIYERPYGIKKR